MISASEPLIVSPPLEESLVTITFSGLVIFCINEQKQCVLGLLHRQDHDRSITVTKGAGSVSVPHDLSLEHDIRVEVEPASALGVEVFEHPDTQFLRKNDQGDDKDIRWIIDMEGPDFHQNGVKIDRPELLRPKFLVQAGQLYTVEKNNSKFARIRFDQPGINQGAPYVGNIGVKMGIAIPRPGTNCTKVTFRNVDSQGQPIAARQPLVLDLQSGSKFTVEVENHCTQRNVALANGTDFRFYYEVLSDRQGSGEMFDLKFTQGLTAGVVPLIDKPQLGLDGDPQACNLIRLSQSTSLGQ